LGIEHLAAVLDHSRQSGSCLVVLLVVASYSDQRGEWVADQATLQRRSRLGRRRVQQILDELVAAGELAVVPGAGRGHRSTYRLPVGAERAKEAAPLPEKGAAGCALSAPPFPPHPPNPPAQQETSGLRPLPGPQSAVFRVNLLLAEAGVPLPSPAQIGLWSKTLGGIEPLLELLARLVQSGLANKREPTAYVHRVVLERAARPGPARPVKPVNPLRTAGVDEVRRRQAARLAGRPSPGEEAGE
jgi:hypothetical protein